MSTLLYRYLTATNSDVLSGTELDDPHMNGVMKLWAFSDNDLATLQVEQLGHKAGVSNIIPNIDSAATVDIKKVPYYTIPVRQGVRPVVVVGGTVSKVYLVFELVPKCNLVQLMTKYYSAGTADALSGTELDTPVKSGIMYIWAFADVVTSTLEVFQSGHKVGRTSIIPITTAEAAPDCSGHPAFVIPVQQGVKPIVVIGGTVQEVQLIAMVV